MGALTKALALINAGSQLIKRCIQYIVGEEVNLTVNWLPISNCLLVYANAIGLGGALSKAIASLQIR